MKILPFLAMATLSITAHAESTVYKCVKADGSTVFSPTPCGKDAKAIGVPKAAASSLPAASDAVREISDSVSDSRCRDDANKLYVEPDTSAITRAEAEMRQLQGRVWYSNGSNSQAQQMASDDATRVVGLRNVIATERARVDTQRAALQKRVDDALTQCENQKKAREQARGQ